MAELEAQGCRLESEKVKAEEALRKEKRSKESNQCLPGPFSTVLPLTCFLFRAGGLHQGQRGAAEAPRGDRSVGGRRRGEASPEAGGSARYDPEIICYVLFLMFFGLS